MPYFTTKDSCKIFYTTHGFDTQKPIVIFLNGTTQTTLYWGSHVPAFSKNFRLLFYDARAQGHSRLGTEPISLKLHVADLKDLTAHLAIDKAHLVGISHGARVALAFAVEYPEVIDHLVLCSLGAKTNDRARITVRSWQEILRLSGLEAMAWAAIPAVFGNQYLKHHHSMIEKIVTAVVKRNNRKALMAQLTAFLRYPPSDRLPQDFQHPVLIISGSEDPLAPPSDVRQLADLCKAHHEELAGIGHSIPAEAPELFEKLVLEFLSAGP